MARNDMRSAVTVSLVPQARGGPFVYWEDLPAACGRAAALGFDAVELFMPDALTVNRDTLRGLLEEHQLRLAAVGTGAGWVIHQLHLVHPDAAQRRQAIDFVRSIIDFGAAFGAPAIIGSMQGRHGSGVDRVTAHDYLRDALSELAAHAAGHGVNLLIEPLNRYETNLLNTLADGVAIVRAMGAANLKLLADLFHMNIEEVDIAAAFREAGSHVGHVHFVDSNRRAAGMGHLDYAPIIAALKAIDYRGYLSAEVLPLPTPEAAAQQTIAAFRQWIAKG